MIVPFAVRPHRATPRHWPAALGLAWNGGRAGLWLWRTNYLHRRTLATDDAITEHYRFAEYGLELEVNNRRRYIKLA